MAKKDIFKIDNYFIRIGILFIIVGTISLLFDPNMHNELRIEKQNESGGRSTSWEDLNGRTIEEVREEKGEGVNVISTEGYTPIIRPIVLLSGVVLLIIGIIYRRKENKIIAIWDALERTSMAKIRDLEANLGMNRTFIFANLKHINAQQNAYFVYVSDLDSVVDGRLLEEHTITTKCNGCGNQVSKTVILADKSKVECNYCGNPVSTSELNKLKADILTSTSANTTQDSGFSTPTFILLLIFFWPAAIVYLVMKKKNSMQNISGKLGEYQELARKHGVNIPKPSADSSPGMPNNPENTQQN